MDALDVLEQQHQHVSELLGRIATEPSPGSRTAMVARLVRLIDAHSRCEERLFYPLLAERLGKSSDRCQIDEGRYYRACEEHAMARYTARQLLHTRVTDVRFEARLALVRKTFLDHAEDEEDWLFQKAKRDLTDEQLDIIGDELVHAFDAHMRASEPSRLRIARHPGRPRARTRPRLAA